MMIDSGASVTLATSDISLEEVKDDSTIITTAGTEQLTNPKRGCLPFAGRDGTKMDVVAYQHPNISMNLLSLSQLLKNHPGSKAAYDENKFTFFNKDGEILLKGWQEGGQWFINLKEKNNEHVRASGGSATAGQAGEEKKIYPHPPSLSQNSATIMQC